MMGGNGKTKELNRAKNHKKQGDDDGLSNGSIFCDFDHHF